MSTKTYNKIYRAEEYAFLKSIGICVQCRKNNAFPNHVYCPECIEKDVLRQANYRQKMTREDKDRRNERARQRRQEHKAQGLCVRCSRPAQYGVLCYYHKIQSIKENRKASEKKRREGRISKRQFKKEQGICYRCDKPIDGNHGSWCAECAEKQAEAVRHNKNSYWAAQNELVFRRAMI